MRKYKKISESDEKAVYEYLWGDNNSYTGLIEINKKKNSASVLKIAKGDKSAERAGAYALYCLPKENYPSTRTHTAV